VTTVHPTKQRGWIFGITFVLVLLLALPAWAITWQQMETDFSACSGSQTVESDIYAEAERRHRFSAGTWKVDLLDTGSWRTTSHDSGASAAQWYNDVESGDGYSFAGSFGYCD
jgi:hypothetical protein